MAAPALDTAPFPPLPDEELARQALAADPDMAIGDDAPIFWDVTGHAPARTLGDWYMPAVVGGTRLLHGWRRRLVLFIIVTFLVIDAYGLCNTYGWVAFG